MWEQAATRLGTPTNKPAIFKLESPASPAATYRLMEAVNAVANYFKHRDEWPIDRTTARGNAKDTIDIATPWG
jgi:hypothetical protein